MSKDNDWRELPCGCLERRVQGDIVTARFYGWLVAYPCTEHSPDTTTTAPPDTVTVSSQ